MILAHGDGASAVRSASDYLGNPMYGVIAEHGPAVAAVAFLAFGVLVVRRSQGGKYARFARLFNRYELLLPVHRLLFWLLSVAGVIHVGLVLGMSLASIRWHI